MAKRAPVGETPYRPLLDRGVIAAALTKATPGTAAQVDAQGDSAKIVDLNRADASSRERPAQSETHVFGGRSDARENPASVEQVVEKRDQEKRMLLTRAESMALDRLVSSLANRVNTQVKLSHILRSL